MTDEEIIKGLNELARYTGLQEKHIQKLNAAVDIINYQKTEIEELEKVLNGQDQLVNALNKCYYLAKSEAVKEFAERLKEKSFKTIRNYGLTKDVVEVCDIDNLVKEMVGK